MRPVCQTRPVVDVELSVKEMSASRTMPGTRWALPRAELATVTYLLNGEAHFIHKGDKSLTSGVAVLWLFHYNS